MTLLPVRTFSDEKIIKILAVHENTKCDTYYTVFYVLYWSTYFVKVYTVCILATVPCWPICEVVSVNKKKDLTYNIKICIILGPCSHINVNVKNFFFFSNRL